ncbi:DUF2913 family protein [Citrobacter portucalensis]|uniref:DUF2913 family protein n=1 Tax=Citrobacter portucalensis TaxID=1639133 RepID=UPI00226B3213|nr:DUF2913 family protein [Citrobacter portucalensis]MCX8985766.1 DUF2913 family protein [Citrobacter portucalensis]
MKSNTTASYSHTSEQVVTDVEHLAWCALVALRLTLPEGQALSPLMTHTFLMRWLAVAQKQRRFPRSIAPDLEKLLRLGRQKGVAADLHLRLENLWHACSGSVSHQSDLYRLAQAIKTLKDQNWFNATVTDTDWDIPALLAEYAGCSALLVKKSDLVSYFSEDGQLIGPVTFLVLGDIRECMNVMQAQGSRMETSEHSDGRSLLTLLPTESSD